MENEIQKLNTDKLIEDGGSYHFCRHERETFNELLLAVTENDVEKISWFALFGSELRHILLNVYAYRKGLEFGFCDIDFDRYGWFKRPVFLELEELKFGLADKSGYGNFSSVTLGRGPNGKWTYGLSICYGTAGSSNGISVYGKVFSSREETLEAALVVLKAEMDGKLGDGDTGNYNQAVILATLKEIGQYRFARMQLSLF